MEADARLRRHQVVHARGWNKRHFENIFIAAMRFSLPSPLAGWCVNKIYFHPLYFPRIGNIYEGHEDTKLSKRINMNG